MMPTFLPALSGVIILVGLVMSLYGLIRRRAYVRSQKEQIKNVFTTYDPEQTFQLIATATLVDPPPYKMALVIGVVLIALSVAGFLGVPDML